MKFWKSFFLAATLCWASASAFSQELQEQKDEKSVEASRYFLGKERELLMPVNILGPVTKPGQFMVPSETDLVSLVAFAGGFTEGAQINDVKIVRKMGDHGKPNIIKVNLEQYYATGDQQLTPPLMPDDTVIISNKKSLAARTIAEIARTAAYAAQIVYIFVLIDKK